MENIIFDDSPLATYLEGEGKGEAEGSDGTERDSDRESLPPPSYAPRGPSTLQARIKDRLPQPLRVGIPQSGPVTRIHTAFSRAVNSRLGRADNTRFLEHFRYIIIASQLLDEHSGSGALKATPAPTTAENHPVEYEGAMTSLTGAAITAATAFGLVWLIHWSRGGRQGGVNKSRLLLVIAAFAMVATIVYAHARRQWLQYLRQQAVSSASTLMTNLQAFTASSSAALLLIQEVELVSRGYRISNPMPPITRLDEQSQNRRCSRLRKVLRNGSTATTPAFLEACSTLRSLVEEDDLEKYFDVYDISNVDLQEALLEYSDIGLEDVETLKALRIYQQRLRTLMRVLLCSLLSLEADGGKPDFTRWRIAVDMMDRVAAVVGEWSEKINRILHEEEQFIVPATPKAPTTPGKERVRAQIRKLSSLSQGIRGLQAKMQILREESNRTIEESGDITELGPSLMAQYESIGADLKSLVQAWETGRASLALSINRHERRISQASSGLRSPVPSLGGLTAVDEGGSPSDALRALNGEIPSRSSMSSASASTSDEEIFEAIAIPRQRNVLSREQRVARIQEDRVRQASAREQREANTSMLKELESVMSLRPKRHTTGRITSL